MNIGFFNAYPYRPHAHQAKFLEGLVKQLGYTSYGLNCDGFAEHCYLRELHGTNRFECVKCMAGGLRTFKFDQSDSIRNYKKNFDSAHIDEKFSFMVESSAYTLSRIESFEQRSSNIVNELTQKLLPSTYSFYLSILNWIEHRQLDFMIVFNGRMDLTRAAVEACITAGIPFISHERPLFGNGLILNRNSNCSSLTKIQQINRDFSQKPLTNEQCNIASKLAAERLTGGNPLEWKRYNTNSTKSTLWPVKTSGPKVLVCPSSKNELLGHPDWITEWNDNTDALDLAVENNWFSYADILIRFHPAWNINFGKVSGELCEKHYFDWCKSRGVTFIQSTNNISTQDLIRLCDVVVVNGSNTVFEAGVLGKPVICLGPSPYTNSNISTDILKTNDFQLFDFENIVDRMAGDLISKTLRYFYSKAVREPLYTNYIRSKTVTECTFREGANPELLDALIKNDIYLVENMKFSKTTRFENEFVDIFKDGEYAALIEMASFIEDDKSYNELLVTRRFPFGSVDRIRNLFPKGL